LILRVALLATASITNVLWAAAQPAAPILHTSPARQGAKNGAEIVSLSSVPGAVIHYTVDGSAPTEHSPRYAAPVLIAGNLTLRAIAIANGQSSPITSRAFTPNIKPDTLVWSDEFVIDTRTITGAQEPDTYDVPRRAGTPVPPNPQIWTYDTGHSGFGNNELQHYCAWHDVAPPCNPAEPNAFLAPDGYLHIVARQTATGVAREAAPGSARQSTPGAWTSARLKTQGLFSVAPAPGATLRIEARMKLPLGQGLWPAFWTLGNSIATVEWPASGEQDIMEHVNAPHPDWIAGSLHGPKADVTRHYPTPPDPRFSAADWHTYGMLWSKGRIAFYVDSPTHPYVTYTPADFTKPGAVWPFDNGQGFFLLLNLAVGGYWPRNPDATTRFPAELLIDYVRIYTQ
jgi:beta-glucanase (GH16 family)